MKPERLFISGAFTGDMTRLWRERIGTIAYHVFIVIALVVCAVAMFTNPEDWGMK